MEQTEHSHNEKDLALRQPVRRKRASLARFGAFVILITALSLAAFYGAPSVITEIIKQANLIFAAKDSDQTGGATTSPMQSSAQNPEVNLDDLIKELTGPQTVHFDREAVLTDRERRVSEPFQIDPDIKDRVAFWFDVYTKYPSDQRIIHHMKYPWLVFKVVDTAPILYGTWPSRRWQRNMAADKLVASETKRVRRALQKIAHMRNLDNIEIEESEIVDILKKIPGRVQKNAAVAARSLRVQTGQKDFFTEGLEISSTYLPDMEKIFADSGIPSELTRLPLVESSFNKLATSKAGASGIWQFVGETGRKFLIVNGPIDERRSPYKATKAAAMLLKENHLILFRSWPLAITAYNHGPAGVRRATRVTHTHDLTKIVQHYSTRSFSFASSNYYAEFLAALYAEKYKDRVFGNTLPIGVMVADDSFALPHSMRTKQILQVTGMTSDELLQHNPDLQKAIKRNASIPKGFRLHVPSDKKDLLQSKFAELNHTAGHLSASNG